MLLKPTEKVHIIERRLFNEDVRRHFIGEVIECSEFAVRIKGHTWVYDNSRGFYQMRPEPRERVFFLGDRLTLNVLPLDADLSSVVYDSESEALRVTDGKTFSLEITEFSAFR
jgi:hypothetical protein